MQEQKKNPPTALVQVPTGGAVSRPAVQPDRPAPRKAEQDDAAQKAKAARYKAWRDKQLAEDEAMREKARADFESYRRQYGSDFDQRARDEYRLSYSTEAHEHKYDIGSKTPYGETMADLLRRHLGLSR